MSEEVEEDEEEEGEADLASCGVWCTHPRLAGALSEGRRGEYLHSHN